jgi:purine-nucleoside phosphorylase
MNANTFLPRHQFEQAAAYIRERSHYRPTIGLILGSGLSPLADQIDQADSLPYASIPNFAATTVPGHRGRLVIGALEKHTVVAMQGRFHFYEGHPIQQVTLPVRVMGLLGVETLIVTNAAGGISADYTPGDLMLIADHINLVGMVGSNPLIGPNDSKFGPRFPDMSQAYDLGLRQVARQVAQADDIPLQEGVYACLAGPSFETPAEIRFLSLIGANAVGMSTVHEVIVARHMGIRVLGISGISNVHSTDPSRPQETSHQEVLAAGRIIAPRLMTLIRGILRQI